MSNETETNTSSDPLQGYDPSEIIVGPNGQTLAQAAAEEIAAKIIVHKTSIGKLTYYSAWEPSFYTGPHGTLMIIDGQVCGKVATRRPSDELLALPAGSKERYERVHAWYEAQKELSYAAIIKVHPEAAAGQRDGMGEIYL